MSAEVKVSVQKGDHKLELLDEALRLADFFDHLEASLKASGKGKADFSVVVKPNIMMFSHKETPPATYTDMELVEHLFDLLRGEGYENLKLVESQNVYGNWYQNRGVVNVARISDHRPDLHGYEVVDLTEESALPVRRQVAEGALRGKGLAGRRL
ncbi:MAG: hypothetical protein JSV27_00075 [Candidatus Bathyarchaeota archaeon]|nr:MAG: hypothetical protein JSV27_00075 [Candidatus Bathyarchaeota archaeon]